MKLTLNVEQSHSWSAHTLEVNGIVIKFDNTLQKGDVLEFEYLGACIATITDVPTIVEITEMFTFSEKEK